MKISNILLIFVVVIFLYTLFIVIYKKCNNNEYILQTCIGISNKVICDGHHSKQIRNDACNKNNMI